MNIRYIETVFKNKVTKNSALLERCDYANSINIKNHQLPKTVELCIRVVIKEAIYTSYL